MHVRIEDKIKTILYYLQIYVNKYLIILKIFITIFYTFFLYLKKNKYICILIFFDVFILPLTFFMQNYTILWADDEIDLLKPHILFL
ncbi:MAG: hypothetical protein EAY69_04330, partial [Cytophagales bacterium]